MIDIRIYPLPLYTILATALLLGGIAIVVLRYTSARRPGADVRRYLSWIIASALMLSLLSGALRHLRHAGTGILVTYGWPKPLYSTWRDPEVDDTRHSLHPRGLLEDLVFYGSASLACAAVFSYLRLRRASGREA